MLPAEDNPRTRRDLAPLTSSYRNIMHAPGKISWACLVIWDHHPEGLTNSGHPWIKQRLLTYLRGCCVKLSTVVLEAIQANYRLVVLEAMVETEEATVETRMAIVEAADGAIDVAKEVGMN